MKIIVFVLVCVSMAVAVPVEEEKRMLIDLNSLIHQPAILNELQTLVDTLGSNATEQQCEGVCRPGLTKVEHSGTLAFACPVICHSLQSLIQKLHLVKDNNPVQTLKKRLVMDSLQHLGLDQAHLKTTLQTIVDAVGSDATEQMVENECHVVMRHPVLDSGCQFIGKLFQLLVRTLHIAPDPNTPGAAANHRSYRSLLDTLGLNATAMRYEAQQIVDLFGSDATTAMIEGYCHSHITHNTGLLDYGCGLLSHAHTNSYQHFATAYITPVTKREPARQRTTNATEINKQS